GAGQPCRRHVDVGACSGTRGVATHQRLQAADAPLRGRSQYPQSSQNQRVTRGLLITDAYCNLVLIFLSGLLTLERGYKAGSSCRQHQKENSICGSPLLFLSDVR
ncbi:hypothetical protein V5799_025626, partial [Amblyomma americanum]